MDSATTTFAEEFASAMQQLSAEAQRPKPAVGPAIGIALDVRQQLAQMTEEFRTMSDRVRKMETRLTEVFGEGGSQVNGNGVFDFAGRFQQLDKQIKGIRDSDSMNQRLFDSLHQEMIKYRDNFLLESLQKPFIRDLLGLFDDLSAISTQLNSERETEAEEPKVTQWRENIENAIHSLLEILHRLEVIELEPRERLDRTLHKVVSLEPTENPEEDELIIARLRRGFTWREKVLRPEEVVASRFIGESR